MHIMIIDDDTDGREALADVMRLDGHTVTTGAAALDVFKCVDNPPEAIILDYYLPGTDGLCLLKHIREELGWQTIPVVLVTGYAGIGTPTGPRGPYGGPFCLLLKPATTDQIYAAIETLKDSIKKTKVTTA